MLIQKSKLIQTKKQLIPFFSVDSKREEEKMGKSTSNKSVNFSLLQNQYDLLNGPIIDQSLNLTKTVKPCHKKGIEFNVDQAIQRNASKQISETFNIPEDSLDDKTPEANRNIMKFLSSTIKKSSSNFHHIRQHTSKEIMDIHLYHQTQKLSRRISYANSKMNLKDSSNQLEDQIAKKSTFRQNEENDVDFDRDEDI